MKSKVHYILVRATFKTPVTSSQAIAEVKDLAALSYEEHYTSAFGDTVDTVFKLKAVKRLAEQP